MKRPKDPAAPRSPSKRRRTADGHPAPVPPGPATWTIDPLCVSPGVRSVIERFAVIWGCPPGDALLRLAERVGAPDLARYDAGKLPSLRSSRSARHVKASGDAPLDGPLDCAPRGWVVVLFDLRARPMREAFPRFEGGAQCALLDVHGDTVLQTRKDAEEECALWRNDHPEADLDAVVARLGVPRARPRTSRARIK